MLLEEHSTLLFRHTSEDFSLQRTTKTWSFGPEGFSYWPGTAYDPVSRKIIALGQAGLESYDPVTRVKTTHVNFGTYAGIARIRDEQGNVIPFAGDPMGYNNSLVYFPGDQKLYYFEHFSRKVWRVDLDRANLSQSWITRLDSVTGTTAWWSPGNWVCLRFKESSHGRRAD